MTDQVYKVRDPQGNIREIRGPEGATDEEVIAQAKSLFGGSTTEAAPNTSLTPDQIALQQKVASESMTRAQHPILTKLAEFGAGLETLPREVLNHVAPSVSNALFPTKGLDLNSGAAIAGSVLDPSAALLGVKAFKLASDAPKVAALVSKVPKILQPITNSVIGGAAAGGAVGGAEGHPIEGVTSGALTGGLIHYPLVVGNKLVNTAMNITSGSTGQVVNYLNKVFGGDKTKVVDALQNLTQTVPLEKLTPAMIDGAGHLRMGALEANARSGQAASEQFAAIDTANRAARRGALESQVHKMTVDEGLPTQRTVNIPEENRAAIADKMYGDVAGNLLPEDAKLKLILSGPDVQSVMGKVQDSMTQAQVNAKVLGGKGPIVGTPSLPGSERWGTPDNRPPATRSVEYLQRVKSALDGEINAASKGLPSPMGLKNLDLSQLKTARGQLVNWVGSQSPGWAEARKTFADNSQLVNQTEYFDKLLQAIDRPTTGEGLAALNTAIKNAPSTFQRATGINRYETPEDVINSLTPVGQQTIKNVQNSMIRQRQLEQNLKAPSTVLPAMDNMLQSAHRVSPPIFSPVITALRTAATVAGLSMNNKARIILHQAMTDPKKIAALLQQVPPAERSQVMNQINGLMRSGEFKGFAAGQVANQNNRNPLTQ